MKKGFTLIELLAVIVILAIIALIATPIILGVVENARKSAAGSSALGYLDAVEKAIALDGLDNIVYPTGNIDILAADYYKDVEVQGEAPSKGSLVVSDRYLITSATLCVNNYKVELTGHKIDKITKNGCEDIEVDPQACNPKTAVKFETASWSEIVEALRTGKTCGMEVGDTKKVILSGSGFNSEGYTLRIANTTTPEECDDAGFSQTACGFVIEFVDIISEQQMNSTAITAGGWNTSALRTYLTNTIYNALPQELKDVMIDTYVVSGHGQNENGNQNYVLESEKIYLLSPHEVYENGSVKKITNDTAWDSTRQLDYYRNLGVTADNPGGAIKYFNGSATGWWLRSADVTGFHDFDRVSSVGDCADQNANDNYGAAPAFRIG